MRVVILTGSDLRHDFFRKSVALNTSIEVVRSYCEFTSDKVRKVIDDSNRDSLLQIAHLRKRRFSEEDFFQSLVELAPDNSSSKLVQYGAINDEAIVSEIFDLKPDLLVAYGCSLVKSELLSKYAGHFVNVHLGLSPYYRGSGTNYWPLVNGEPEYVGATFMYIDAGIDTGEIIHQVRARCYEGDSPHQIGNRLIADMTRVYIDIILKHDSLKKMAQPSISDDYRLYKRSEFSVESVVKLYDNFSSGMIEHYLDSYADRVAAVPIVENPDVECV